MGPRRDVMGSVFLRVSTVFSSHAVWAERDPCHEHNSLIVPLRCSGSGSGGWIRLTATGHTPPSTFHYGHWPRDLRHGLGVLRRHSAHCCPSSFFFFFFDLDLVCFGDRRNVSGILCTCQLKLLWIHSRQSKKKDERKTNAAVPCLDRLTRLGAAAALLMPAARGREEPC